MVAGIRSGSTEEFHGCQEIGFGTWPKGLRVSYDLILPSSGNRRQHTVGTSAILVLNSEIGRFKLAKCSQKDNFRVA